MIGSLYALCCKKIMKTGSFPVESKERKAYTIMKGNFSHISFEQRKVIASMIKSEHKLKDIGAALNLDPTSVSKEVKRNRIRLYPKYNPNMNLQLCRKLDRFPYVCNTCKDRYSPCPFEKYEYKAHEANQKAKTKLVMSRRGVDCDSREFRDIDETIKKGIESGLSVYQIVNSSSVGKSVSTIYRYINLGYLTTRRIDLPLAVTYKKRRKIKKKYDYDTNKSIDRSNHTYLDYLYQSRKVDTKYIFLIFSFLKVNTCDCFS